jgi:hypothetical protein
MSIFGGPQNLSRSDDKRVLPVLGIGCQHPHVVRHLLAELYQLLYYCYYTGYYTSSKNNSSFIIALYDS